MEENKKKIYKSDSLHVAMLLTKFDKKIKETHQYYQEWTRLHL